MHTLLTLCCSFTLLFPQLHDSCFFLSKSGRGVISLGSLLQASAMPSNMPEFSWLLEGIVSSDDPFFWIWITGGFTELPAVADLINAGPGQLWLYEDMKFLGSPSLHSCWRGEAVAWKGFLAFCSISCKLLESEKLGVLANSVLLLWIQFSGNLVAPNTQSMLGKSVRAGPWKAKSLTFSTSQSSSLRYYLLTSQGSMRY